MGDLPNLKVTIDVRQDSVQLRQSLVSLSKEILPEWRGVDDGLAQVDNINGGISNVLFKLSAPTYPKVRTVAIKIFGDKTELVINRPQERQLLSALNQAGFGARVLGRFENGRVEEFLLAKTLTPEEMASAKFSCQIAKHLNKFHSLDVDLKVARISSLFPTIHCWLGMARMLQFDDLAKQQQYAQVDFAAVASEVDANEELCALTGSPVVLSHNDLLSGNILILEGSGAMQFIDFEYSAWGLRGFDLGNHFNEYAGFECDYRRYPDTHTQRLFLSHYLAAGGEEATEQALDRLAAEANVFSLTSHLYWSIWSLIQAAYSPIDFDYIGYSRLRWDEYMRRKPVVLAQAQQVYGAQGWTGVAQVCTGVAQGWTGVAQVCTGVAQGCTGVCAGGSQGCTGVCADGTQGCSRVCVGGAGCRITLGRQPAQPTSKDAQPAANGCEAHV